MMLLWALLACGPKPGGSKVTTYHVYDGDTHVLTFEDEPGPLMSTAALPPGQAPRQHPFLSGTAHSAEHEHLLGTLLSTAQSPEGFIAALEQEGLRVTTPSHP
jgi:hypothetical protein